MQNRDMQRETMRLYGALADVREDWGGRLVLLCGPGCALTGAPAAVSIAGGTTLALDSDGVAVKAAQRAGRLDFVVNTLDEALRALKNEVRQRRPLSVGLIADVEATLGEMAERGVAPDLRMESGAQSSAVRGEYFFAAQDAAGLRELDAALLGAVPAEDLVRRHWIQRAPQFLREARAGGRWIWLSEDEVAALAARGITPQPRS
jgi:urocanate hydratase